MKCNPDLRDENARNGILKYSNEVLSSLKVDQPEETHNNKKEHSRKNKS
jgi:hypothetical protein